LALLGVTALLALPGCSALRDAKPLAIQEVLARCRKAAEEAAGLSSAPCRPADARP
jgi:hypothetical protein